MAASDKDFTLVSTEELTDLLNYKREYFKICDEFKVPVQQRGWPTVGRNIIERIHTYLTAYVGRRSIAEKEVGSAFRDGPPPEILDPEPNPKADFKG